MSNTGGMRQGMKTKIMCLEAMQKWYSGTVRGAGLYEECTVCTEMIRCHPKVGTKVGFYWVGLCV